MFTTFTLRYSKDEVIKDKLLNLIIKSSLIVCSFEIDIFFTNLINILRIFLSTCHTHQNIMKI